ncbi:MULTISPECIES: surface lipoprotein assembly modifier [unclassified Pasteurella]|uniref:surface lipoprotein assembly modifier n=1 Tax=unclassified Pasteurella TaxID=2621516 RepID=UPI001073E13C|nr:DUF560 domain-containing protein [Pasteurella sp. 19428wF3_WM03]TFU51052.1 DUF560 domain-containing protein [Pasteurella sp. WM03]
MKTNKFLTALFSLFFTLPASANFADPQQNIKVATPQKVEPVVSLQGKNQPPLHFSEADLKNNPILTQQLLTQAIYARDPQLIEKLLAIYKTFPENDRLLVQFAEAKHAALSGELSQAIRIYREMLAERADLNPVRIELAIALFQDKQNTAATEQFQKALSDPATSAQVQQLINAYLDALQERDSWQISASAYYVRDTNVNNTGDSRNIEQTGFVKNDDMMPQTAHGIAYNLYLGKDFNLGNRYYLGFENDLSGKSYWDNHDYDDIYNRTSLGLRYKTAQSTLSLLPFYEKRWYGGESYQWANGARLELSHWLNPNWQLSSAAEFAKQRYFDAYSQDGNRKLISATLVWARTPRQFFYFGGDFNREITKVKQYSSDTKSIRLGWGQEWGKGISSRLGFGISQRHYKDEAVLGRLIALGKVRKDRIFNVNLTLWKRDWHFLGITPKLQFSYRKQKSNIPTMYSYDRQNLNLIFEKSF